MILKTSTTAYCRQIWSEKYFAAATEQWKMSATKVTWTLSYRISGCTVYQFAARRFWSSAVNIIKKKLLQVIVMLFLERFVILSK